MERWLWDTAADLGRGIARGDICPLALTETYLEAIDAHPLKSRTYARLTRDRAMAEGAAAKTRAATGQRRGLLDGVPISWKDLFDTSGVPTEAGSKLLADRTPTSDAEVVQKAGTSGLVCLGKTHMSELAFSGLGYNPSTATPPCVNDPDAVSGGSSSGAAASVAFGMAAAGIGSDTGGSVRVPAAWNDLVGLKTTSGRLSLAGVVELCARFDTVGPLARSVEDCVHLLAAMESGTPVDLRASDLRGARLAVLETVAMEDVRSAPADAFEQARAKLEAAGATVTTLKISEVSHALELAGVLYAAEAYGTWRDVIEAAPGKMYAQIRERFRAGAGFSGPDFVAAWQALDRHRAVYAAATASFDAVIMPSSPSLPPNLARLNEDHDYYVAENLLALRNTRIGNLMGLCALTLPTGTPSCGLMLCAAPMDEARLLRLGHAVEQVLA